MWKDYFPGAEIYGIDTKPECKDHEAERIKIFIGNQSDKKFLKSLAPQLESLNVVIDDGSHIPNDQIASFEVLFPILLSGGYYVIEDLRTHYCADRLKRGLWFFNETMANLHQVETRYPIEEIHFYKSIVFIKKGK
jgi:cephalosporin hydroxylase